MPGLFLALLLVPIVEIWVIVRVGQTIGAGPTILLLVLDGMVGAWLIRHEGRRAWQALMQTLSAGRMPTRELADGGLVLVGGTLLIAPGFLTDILGYLFVLPFTRPLVRGALVRYLAGRVRVVTPPGMSPPGAKPGPTRSDGRVVSGEVVDDGRPPRER
jgi:UPF0716 protein FxsA